MPACVNDFQALCNAVCQWCPPTPAARRNLLLTQIRHIARPLIVMAAVLTLLIAEDPRLATLAALVCLALYSWQFILVHRAQHLDKFSRRSRWMIVLSALVILVLLAAKWLAWAGYLAPIEDYFTLTVRKIAQTLRNLIP